MSGGIGPTGCDISLPKEQELGFKEQHDQQSLKNLNKPTTPQDKVGFLSFNQLNALAVVIVLSASGLVSPEDFAFVFECCNASDTSMAYNNISSLAKDI